MVSSGRIVAYALIATDLCEREGEGELHFGAERGSIQVVCRTESGILGIASPLGEYRGLSIGSASFVTTFVSCLMRALKRFSEVQPRCFSLLMTLFVSLVTACSGSS